MRLQPKENKSLWANLLHLNVDGFEILHLPYYFHAKDLEYKLLSKDIVYRIDII